MLCSLSSSNSIFVIFKSSIENFKRAATGSVISGISRKDIEDITNSIDEMDINEISMDMSTKYGI